MTTDVAQSVYAQAGALGIMIVGGSLVIWHMWTLINRLLAEAREDRKEFIAALNSTNRVTEANATSLSLHTSAVHALREVVDDMNTNLDRLIDRTTARDRGN